MLRSNSVSTRFVVAVILSASFTRARRISCSSEGSSDYSSKSIVKSQRLLARYVQTRSFSREGT